MPPALRSSSQLLLAADRGNDDDLGKLVARLSTKLVPHEDRKDPLFALLVTLFSHTVN